MEHDAPILIAAMDPLPDQAIRHVQRTHAGRQIVLFAHNHEASEQAYPVDWRRIDAADVIDVDQLREDFLNFTDAWPRQNAWRNRTFGQLFSRVDGYSLWWTGPGVLRQPLIKIFPTIRALWLISRVFQQIDPDCICVFTEDRRMASILESKLSTEGFNWQWLAGSAQPARSAWRGRWKWLRHTLSSTIGTALRLLLSKWRSTEPDAVRPTKTDTIVLNMNYPRHIRRDGEKRDVWYWQALTDALAKLPGRPAVKYLLCPKTERRWLDDFQSSSQERKRDAEVKGLLRPCYGSFTLRFWLRATLRQIGMVCRYFRLERSRAFRQSFHFLNADLSVLYLPELRRTLRDNLSWEFQVQTVTETLRAAGPVRVVVVDQEMHPTGAIVIAACRRLRIPTVGAQHGHVYPLHMMYTLPPGQVERAPIPDYLAAYGEYTKDVISQCGHYPQDRIWVVGSPRFDWLVNEPPPSSQCRERLGLPSHKWLLVVATKRDTWTPRVLRDVVAAARKLDHVCVCIKPWVKDGNKQLYDEIVASSGEADVRLIDAPFEELLGACDAVASICSTTLLEATLLGKPSISLNYTGEPERYPYSAEGVSLSATNREEVLAAVSAAKSFQSTSDWNARRIAFLQRHLGPNMNGKSGETIAQKLAEHFFRPGEVNPGATSDKNGRRRSAA